MLLARDGDALAIDPTEEGGLGAGGVAGSGGRGCVVERQVALELGRRRGGEGGSGNVGLGRERLGTRSVGAFCLARGVLDVRTRNNRDTRGAGVVHDCAPQGGCQRGDEGTGSGHDHGGVCMRCMKWSSDL